MVISIARDGVEVGEWNEDQVRALHADGQLLGTDLYWHEGLTEWKPLRDLMKPALSPRVAEVTARVPSAPPPLPDAVLEPVAIVDEATGKFGLFPEGWKATTFRRRCAARVIDYFVLTVNPGESTKHSSSWDVGQIDEDCPITVGDRQAIDAAHDAMREYFPRSTPPYQSGKRTFVEEVPPPTVRQLPPVDAEDPVNLQARKRALDSIRPAHLFTEGAAFVGRDANRAVLTRHHDDTYFIGYFDTGASMPWKTARYDSLENAVVAVTGRQLYLFGNR